MDTRLHMLAETLASARGRGGAGKRLSLKDERSGWIHPECVATPAQKLEADFSDSRRSLAY